MNDNIDSNDKQHSWLYKLSTLLLREPQDQKQLVQLLREAAQRKLFNEEALPMLEGVLSIHEKRAKDVSINKQQMVTLKENQSIKEVLKIIITAGHSRFPVYNSTENEIIGLIHAKDLFKTLDDKKHEYLDSSLLRKASFIPENKRLDSLLKEFRLNKNHMALIIDEYGHVVGLITIEDVLEQIVGDIQDEFDINHNVAKK